MHVWNNLSTSESQVNTSPGETAKFRENLIFDPIKYGKGESTSMVKGVGYWMTQGSILDFTGMNGYVRGLRNFLILW